MWANDLRELAILAKKDKKERRYTDLIRLIYENAKNGEISVKGLVVDSYPDDIRIRLSDLGIAVEIYEEKTTQLNCKAGYDQNPFEVNEIKYMDLYW